MNSERELRGNSYINGNNNSATHKNRFVWVFEEA